MRKQIEKSGRSSRGVQKARRAQVVRSASTSPTSIKKEGGMDGSGRAEFRNETLPICNRDVEGNDNLFDSAVSPPPRNIREPSIMEKFSRYLRVYAKLVGSRIDRRVEELRFIKLEKKEEAWKRSDLVKDF